MNKIEQELEKVNYFIDHCPNVGEAHCRMFLEDKQIKVSQYKSHFYIDCNDFKCSNLRKKEAKDLCKKLAYGEQKDLSIIRKLKYSTYEYTNKFGSMEFELQLDDNNDYQSSWIYYLLLNGCILNESDYKLIDELSLQETINEYIKLFDENRLVFVDGGIVIVDRDDTGNIINIVKCVGDRTWY